MPNDPYITPSIDDPVLRSMQKNSQLEARVAALEAKRDLLFTPVSGSAVPNQSTTFTWRGGRLWMFVTATLTGNAGLATGAIVLAYSTINGVQASSHSIQAVNVAAATFKSAADSAVFQIDPTAYALSTTNTFAVTLGTNAYDARLQGLIIEWPQA